MTARFYNTLPFKRRILRAMMMLLPLLPLLPHCTSAANGFAVHAAWFQQIGEDGEHLELRTSTAAGPEDLLQQILQSGYAVRMQFYLRVMRERRWLPDKEIASLVWEPTIAYDSLLERYTFRGLDEVEEFSTLAEVLERAGALRSQNDILHGVDADGLYLLASYDLQTSHLPPPLQVSLLTGEEDIHSGWVRLPLIILP